MAMLLTFKKVISDYCTLPGLTLQRDLTHHISRQVDFLTKSRSLAASMKTAIRLIKKKVSEYPIDVPDCDACASLCETIDDFIRDRITVSGQAINDLLLNSGKIKNGDVILVYSRSSTVLNLLKETLSKGISFSVIVIDSRPLLEGIAAFLTSNRKRFAEGTG